jgi:alanine racemase
MAREHNRLSIDLSALAHNLGQIRDHLQGQTRIMAIVKSDAYGHGLTAVSRTLEERGVDCLGVAYSHEAVHLREQGIRVPIVILCGIHSREEFSEAVSRGLRPILFDLSTAEGLDREAARLKKTARFYLEVDSGMGRLGVPMDRLPDFVKKLRSFKSIVLEGLLSHLSSADTPGDGYTENQITRFRSAIDACRVEGAQPSINTLANSAGIMGFKGAHFDMVRPGIMLYGGLPRPRFQAPVRLKPVMTFKGIVLQVRDFPDQTPISYGRTYCTAGPRRLAVLSAGYGDGLPRSMSNRGHVLVKGRKVSITGSICMNMTMVDVTNIPDVKEGDEAVFLGSQSTEIITGDDVAEWAGNISYEVFCSIGQRHTKDYIS